MFVLSVVELSAEFLPCLRIRWMLLMDGVAASLCVGADKFSGISGICVDLACPWHPQARAREILAAILSQASNMTPRHRVIFADDLFAKQQEMYDILCCDFGQWIS